MSGICDPRLGMIIQLMSYKCQSTDCSLWPPSTVWVLFWSILVYSRSYSSECSVHFSFLCVCHAMLCSGVIVSTCDQRGDAGLAGKILRSVLSLRWRTQDESVFHTSDLLLNWKMHPSITSVEMARLHASPPLKVSWDNTAGCYAVVWQVLRCLTM